jgi:hypothetical protein
MLVFSVAPFEAAENAKANTLSKKEIGDGWILLFDGATTFGWKIGDADGGKGEASVKEGQLILETGKHKPFAELTSSFQHFEIQFDYRTEGSDEFTSFSIDAEGIGGKEGTLSGFGLNNAGGKDWGHARIRFGPNGQTTYIKFPKGKPLQHKEAPKLPKPHGICKFTFSPDHDKRSKLFLRNIKLKPLGLKWIFSGKDLSGWKEIKGEKNKSKFTVTDKGELNLKDGPGDIQTESQWADFVLQLECFSNGKHLNSGVFFRCLPGQFWSGYEAQIRNQWQGDDRSKPVDYGTGGIYNRQPARKVVSSDKEWFTMTIVAGGKHLAVWVNGYQTADFTDMRKPDKSARNGSKVDKGPISLQGHDKTTDLSFRNIRIAELPQAKK